jgi:hypothetical protein
MLAAGTILSLAAGAVPAQARTARYFSHLAPAVSHGHLPSASWLRNGWLSPVNKQLSSRIFTDRQVLRRQGVRLTQWGPDPATGKTKVYLTHYSRAAARVLYARYGSAIVVSRHSMARPVRASRGSDTPPYIGGDYLWIPATRSICTGGPIVKNGSGQLRMLTAGHCTAAVGNFVYRSTAGFSTTGPHMGNVVDRVRCNGCLDSSVVDHNSSGSSYAAQVWGASNSTPDEPRYNENGTAFPNPANCPGGTPGCAADLVTQDSAITGEITGITVTKVDQTVTFNDGISTRALSVATKNGQVIDHEGDSGGPWIVHTGSTVAIAGTTVGQTTSGTTAYYEEIGPILSKYNLTVP